MIGSYVYNKRLMFRRQKKNRLRIIERDTKRAKRSEGCRKKEEARRERKRKTSEIGTEAVKIAKGTRRTRGKKRDGETKETDKTS